MLEKTPNRKTMIIDIAERMIREVGYNGFSFREIAQEIGIKSSSVHYHFPSKEDLGVVVTQRYTDRFLASLGPAEDFAPTYSRLNQQLESAVFGVLETDEQMCLCGVLAAEKSGLPNKLVATTRSFFDRLRLWLETAITHTEDGKDLSSDEIQTLALSLVARMQGGMMLACIMGDNNLFPKTMIPPSLKTVAR